jgi:hypothetical protein
MKIKPEGGHRGQQVKAAKAVHTGGYVRVSPTKQIGEKAGTTSYI